MLLSNQIQKQLRMHWLFKRKVLMLNNLNWPKHIYSIPYFATPPPPPLHLLISSWLFHNYAAKVEDPSQRLQVEEAIGELDSIQLFEMYNAGLSWQKSQKCLRISFLLLLLRRNHQTIAVLWRRLVLPLKLLSMPSILFLRSPLSLQTTVSQTTHPRSS